MTSARAWIVPASTAFFVLVAALLGGTLLGPGCQTRCERNFDCGGGAFCDQSVGRCETQCFDNLDCIHPAACQGNPSACKPMGLRCNSIGKCVGQVRFDHGDDGTPVPPNPGPDIPEGWNVPPASGKAFIVNQIAIADKGRGFDIDGKCATTGCIDNFLWRLGELGNDQIRQGLLGGESLLLIELAGLPDSYHGDVDSMTVKIYGARDADDPFFPANNFKVPPGHTTCCQFKINPQSLYNNPETNMPQARARAPAEIRRGVMRSLAPVPIEFTLTVGVAPHPQIRIERMLLSGRVPSELDELGEGLLGGAVPINTLARTENPYCKTVSPRCPSAFTDSTLIDLVSTLLGPEPDIDLDFDGNECVLDTDGNGGIDLCCDGAPRGLCRSGLNSCPGSNPVASLDPTDPNHDWMCALAPEVADGFSIGITFTAVPATIVGIGQ